LFDILDPPCNMTGDMNISELTDVDKILYKST